ncbi:hypothetical protein ROZALSC1DRAFT_24165 [Rozella allomycis CSF55]|nr:hypothetical protein ROZALSC1DRAFT_24165 [Rozella allomycis CSF55]
MTISGRILGQPSSTRPELFAIISGLTQCPANANIKVFSDSQNALTIMNTIFSKFPYHTLKPTKTPNLDIIDHALYLRSQFAGSILFEHVKGHSGIELNELADQQAKAATLTSIIHYIPSIPTQQNYYLYHNDILITQPPRALIHQVFNTLRKIDLESKYHPDELRFISMHNSVITCTNTDKQSDLSFRLKLLTQRLPVQKGTLTNMPTL